MKLVLCFFWLMWYKEKYICLKERLNFMKKSILKKIAASVTSVVMMTGLLACNTKIDVKFDYDAGEYVKLGQYKGLEVEFDGDAIADALLEKRINNDAKDNTVYTSVKRGAQDGDRLYLTFYGYVSGVKEEAFSDEDYEFILGEDKFVIDGFTDALYGMKPGESKVITLTIPEDFAQNETYAGRKIVYEITMDSVEQGALPMITDAYVKEAYGFDTVDLYKESLRAELKETADELILDSKKDIVFSKLMSNCEMETYPQEVLEKKSEEYSKSIEFYALMQNMTVEEYCKDKYNVTFDEYVKAAIKQDAVLQMIIKAENLSITEYEYKGDLESFAQDNGYSLKSTFVEEYGKDKIVQAMLLRKAENIVLDSAIYNEPK